MTVLVFIIVLAALILAHELGHFLVARACGVRVDKFALGFGPRIVSWKGKETEYALNLIPFGGYVKSFGEDPNEENTSGPDSSKSLVNKPRSKQILVLASGVLANFIFAWLLYAGVFASGVTASVDGFEKYADLFHNQRVMITYVLPDSPAEKAGLKEGDVFVSVGGKVRQSVADIQNTINSVASHTISVEYARGSGLKSVEIIPASGLVTGKYAIGIAMDNVVDLKLPFFNAVSESLRYTLTLIKETFVSLYGFVADIFRGAPNFSEVTGPVGIAGIVGNAAQLGFTYLLMVTALISINLGVVNLIPFPALDGGRILVVAIEGAVRRRIPAKVINAVNLAGFALLMVLMVIVTWQDIARLIK